MFAAAAAAAVAIAACQPSPSPVPTGAPVAPSATAATTSIGWTSIDLPDAIGPWEAAGVIADADGFVIYGAVNDEPAAWTSVDGEIWASMRLPGFHAAPSQAATSDTATVLLGVGSTDQCAHPLGEFLWQRAKGQQAWVAAPFVEDLFCLGGDPRIAATGSAFVVAGSSSGDSPLAWQSGTGLTWVDTSRDLPADTLPTVLTATDAGFLELARGNRADAESSADGLHWKHVGAPPVGPAFDPNGNGMSPVALLPDARGVLAFYEPDGGSIPAAFRREADGSWTAVALAGFGEGDTVLGGTTIGARTYLFLRRPGAAAVLVSDDGSTWAPLETPRLDTVSGLAAFGGHVVLVGAVSAANGDQDSRVFVSLAAP
jgi:hypothetical protein